MTSKKYNLLLIVCMFLATGAFAQTGSGYNIYDSSVIPSKSMGQQNEFWNNSYDFPAKPRNQWEVGVSAGAFNVLGDVSTKFPTLGFAAHIRKAFGYIFSLRAQYLNGTAIGQNWKISENFGNNDVLSKIYSAPDRRNLPQTTTIPGKPQEVVYYNYKTKSQDLGLQGIFTLNNIRFHKAKTGFVLYMGAGIGATAYNVHYNALGADGKSYSSLYTQVASTPSLYDNRKKIIKALKDGMDNTYETKAEDFGGRHATLGKNTLVISETVLAGVAFKLSKRVNLALEDRHTFVKTDLLDGQQWQEHPVGDAALTPNWDSYNYLSLGLNFNIGAKSVEPLWWLNPLDYAYSELNNPKHMKLPKPVYNDADGDGVPDCKDKQLITPTECQPVDADGVGKCPDPECCKNMAATTAAACPTDYPSLSFKGNSVTLSSDAKALLATTAAKMKASPACNINIDGYPEASKASQSVCQKRADAIKMYLVEKEGISADRISTNCVVGGGDKNTVDIKSN